MKQKIPAILCLLSIVVGILALSLTAADSGTYMVGYAKININPYVYKYHAFWWCE